VSVCKNLRFRHAGRKGDFHTTVLAVPSAGNSVMAEGTLVVFPNVDRETARQKKVPERAGGAAGNENREEHLALETVSPENGPSKIRKRKSRGRPTAPGR